MRFERMYFDLTQLCPTLGSVEGFVVVFVLHNDNLSLFW